MKHVLCALCLLGAGCESCDFSFGPIPVELSVTPRGAKGTITLCDQEGKEVRCNTLSFPQSPEELPPNWLFPEPPPEGTVQTMVDWDGYVACRFPGLEIDVQAEGCEPLHVSVPKSKPRGREILRVDLELDCP